MSLPTKYIISNESEVEEEYRECYECGISEKDENVSLLNCGYRKKKYTCEKCGHYEMEHEHVFCEDCGKQCDNCQEFFCDAYNRKCGMEVCDDCMMYNG